MQEKTKSQRFIWIDIMLTLLTLVVMEYFYYGVRALLSVGICMAISLISEVVCLRMLRRRFTADDLTCISDAVILSLMLPAVINNFIASLGCIFSVVIAKHVLGGRKELIFSPAAAGYVFLLTSWRGNVLMFTEPHVHTGIFEKAETLVSSASHSFNTTGKMSYTDFEILMGNMSGPAGAVSILLLAVAAVILILRRDISTGAFIGTILGTGMLSVFVPMCSDPLDSLKYTLCTNMVLFSAIYIISDKRIAPKRNYYAFFYGFFIASFSYILVLTTAKENAIVIVLILFAPVAMGFRNLEKKIEKLKEEENAAKDFSEGQKNDSITEMSNTEEALSDE